jgi:hypothetical protein
MKSFKISLNSFTLIALISSLVQSCGLKYEPTETRESFYQKRQLKISEYILSQMNGQTLSYSPIAYGKTIVLKPISYKKLDSLYEIKYQNELAFIKDRNLEEKISNQRLIALNDTSKVLYLENHVFSLDNKDTVEFYNTIFQLTSDIKIDDIKINQSVFLPAKFGELYRKYLFEESYLNALNSANTQEKAFYEKYKDALVNRSIAQQNEFILHSLKLMELSVKLRTTSNRELLKQLSINSLKEIYPNAVEVEIAPIKENTIRLETGKVITESYKTLLNFTLFSADKTSKEIKTIQILFNQFLELKEIIQ